MTDVFALIFGIIVLTIVMIFFATFGPIDVILIYRATGKVNKPVLVMGVVWYAAIFGLIWFCCSG